VAFAETQKLVVELDLKGNLNAKLGDAARALKGFDRATSNTQQSLSKFGRNIERGIVLGAAAAAGGFVAVAKAAGDFEAEMNTIATIVDRKDIARIGEALRKTARDTGISLEDLTSAYYDLASAGVKGQLATDALNDAVMLGIGGLATTAETVDLLTTAINAYQLDSKGAAKATDQFALAVADGKVKASEIAATFADVASVAKTYKVGIDQIAASYAVLTAQGVPAGEVTTEMQRAIISLINPTKDLEIAQKKLGISFTKEIASKGLVGALQELRVYSDKTGIPLIALLGRIEAVKYTLQTTGPNFQTYNTELAKMEQASGTAAAQMAERQQGLNFQLARLKALAKDAGITIGSALLPKLTPLVEKLNAFISSNQSKIADFGTKLASGFEKLADAIGKVDWSPFIDGLKLSGDIAKTVIGAFRSLPADLQKLVIAGFALNKVTGGLGTSIAKDLGGAILGNFATRGSSPANPMWVAEVGGGLGGAGGAAAGTGLKAVLAGAGLLIGTDVILSQLQTANLGIAQIKAGAFGVNVPGVTDQPSVLQASIAAHHAGGVQTGGLSPEDRQNLSDAAAKLDERLGQFAGEFARTSQATRRGFSSVVDAIHRELFQAQSGLRNAKGAEQIAAAIKRVMASLIGGGLGGVGGASRTLGDLKAQLANTHDPKLQAVLKAAIEKVERKLASRQIVAEQTAKLKDILGSNLTTAQKIVALQGVEKAIGNRDAHETKRVHDAIVALKAKQHTDSTTLHNKIDAAKRAQVHEIARTTHAVMEKDLSVTTNISNPTTVVVNSREVASSAAVYHSYFVTGDHNR